MLCEVPQKRLPWRGLLLCERPPPRAARSVGPCFETGWTPQPPRWGFVIKRFLGFCGSRSWRGWSWAAKSEPKHGFRQRPSPPFWGARRPDAGVRPDAEHPKGARCTTRTSSLIRTTQKHQWSTVCPLFASEASTMGGRKCVVHVRKHCSFPNQSSGFTTADAFSGGRANARVGPRKTKAFAHTTSSGPSGCYASEGVTRSNEILQPLPITPTPSESATVVTAFPLELPMWVDVGRWTDPPGTHVMRTKRQ